MGRKNKTKLKKNNGVEILSPAHQATMKIFEEEKIEMLSKLRRAKIEYYENTAQLTSQLETRCHELTIAKRVINQLKGMVGLDDKALAEMGAHELSESKENVPDSCKVFADENLQLRAQLDELRHIYDLLNSEKEMLIAEIEKIRKLDSEQPDEQSHQLLAKTKEDLSRAREEFSKIEMKLNETTKLLEDTTTKYNNEIESVQEELRYRQAEKLELASELEKTREMFVVLTRERELERAELEKSKDREAKLESTEGKLNEQAATIEQLRKASEELENFRENHMKDVDQLRLKCEDQQKQVELLQQQLLEANQSISLLSKEKDEIFEGFKTKEAEFAKISEEVALLRSVKEVSKRANTERAEEISKLKNELEKKIQEIELLKIDSEKVSQLQFDNNAKSIEITDLTVQLQSTIAEKQTFEQELGDQRRSLVESKQETCKAKEELRCLEEKFIAFKNSESEHAEMMETLKKQLEEAVASETSSKNLLTKLEEDLQKSKDLSKHLEATKKDLSKSRRQIDKFKQEARKAKNEIETIRKKSNEEVDAIRKRANDEVIEIKKSIEYEAKQHDQIAAELEKAKTDIESSNREIDQLQTQIQKSKLDTEKIRFELEVTQKSLEEKSQQHAQVSTDLKQLHLDLEASRKNFNDVKAELDQSKENVEKIRTEMQNSQKALKQEIEERQQAVATLEYAKSELQKSLMEIGELKEQLKTSDESLEGMRKQLEESKSSTNELSQLKDERNQNAVRIDQLTADLETAKAELAKALAEVHELKVEADKAREDVVHVKNTDQQHQEEVQQYEEEIKKYVHIVEVLRKSISDMRTENEHLKEAEKLKVAEADERVKQLTRENLHFKEEIRKFGELLQKKAIEHHELQNEFEELKIIARTSCEKAESLMKVVDGDAKKIETMIARIAQLEETRRIAETETKTLKDSLTDLTKQLEQKNREVVNMTAEREQAEEKLKHLEDIEKGLNCAMKTATDLKKEVEVYHGAAEKYRNEVERFKNEIGNNKETQDLINQLTTDNEDIKNKLKNFVVKINSLGLAEPFDYSNVQSLDFNTQMNNTINHIEMYCRKKCEETVQQLGLEHKNLKCDTLLQELEVERLTKTEISMKQLNIESSVKELNAEKEKLENDLKEKQESLNNIKVELISAREALKVRDQNVLDCENEARKLRSQLDMVIFEKEQLELSKEEKDATARVLELEREIIELKASTQEKIDALIEETRMFEERLALSEDKGKTLVSEKIRMEETVCRLITP
ncbi:unnamed protein product [Caenorhabditis bovis]|uniref:Uncharacterized protein n=1 Tax=Caenorhabditis bovis TaxID=2654633 RepID=A0A8S1F7A6_9PELO|nr:unnamed protein product [Caenorhabditis bovis]